MSLQGRPSSATTRLQENPTVSSDENDNSEVRQVEEPIARLENTDNGLGDFGLVDSDGIYSAVRCGLCVNEVSNPTTGDTLLHAAAKQDSPELAIALLQCGADSRLRNRLGRCAADDSGPSVSAVLQFFQPCLPEALDTANFTALRNLCHSLWVNVHAVIRDGNNSMEIMAMSRQPTASKCYKVLADFAPLSSVMHALLANDVAGLEATLKEGGFLPPADASHLHRLRQCPTGPDGRTLLSIALDRGDMQSAKLLLDAGASSRGRLTALSTQVLGDTAESRVTTSTQSKPLAWSVLRNICPVANEANEPVASEAAAQAAETNDESPTAPSTIPSEAPLDLVLQYDPVAVLTQRDSLANTTLHAALSRNCELSKLSWLIERRPALLTERNSQAQCVRELAAALYRQDALKLFESVVKNSIGTGRDSLVTMLACRGHGDCCLRPSRILADDARGETGELAAVASQRGSDLERSLLCTEGGLSRIESIGRDHLRACADGNLKLVQKTNFAAFQEPSTGCTGLTAAICGEHRDVASYLLATHGVELTRLPDNSGRYPLHYIYALMHSDEEDLADAGEQSTTRSSAETHRQSPNPLMTIARQITKCDPTCWSLEDSLGRRPIDMSQLGQSPEAKNMLWGGWMVGRSATN